MKRRILILAGALAFTIFAAPRPEGTRAAPQEPKDNRPLSHEEIVSLMDRAIANQHRSDQVILEYERVEHAVQRSGGSSPRILLDKIYRVVPTGTGTLKLLLKDGGKPVDAETYRKELTTWEQNLAASTGIPDFPQSDAKFQKKMKDRAELIDSMRQAYKATWLGRERSNGRVLEKIQLEPNPQFQPHSLVTEILTHARAVIWVDSQIAQMVRGETEIIRDVSFGGGILGKVYRGAHFEMEQAEIAPGLWLPTRYQLDYSARKFLFVFEQHDVTEISRFRRLGTPAQALAVVRHELASKAAFSGDP
jgi:hypothetical protein